MLPRALFALYSACISLSALLEAYINPIFTLRRPYFLLFFLQAP